MFKHILTLYYVILLLVS